MIPGKQLSRFDTLRKWLVWRNEYSPQFSN